MKNIIIIIIIFFTFLFYYENTKSKIPKIIIQTWKTNVIPNKYISDITSVRKFNKDYKFIFFTDNDINDFIIDNYPEYYDTYNRLPVKIQKFDFFRYIAIYHYGGFYLDLDITCFKSFNDLLKYDSVFPIDTIIKEDDYEYDRFNLYKDKIQILLGQYAFGASKNNLFIKLLINTINNNINLYIKNYYNIINNNNYNKYKNYFEEVYVYKTTGPDFVTNVFLKYNHNYNIKILDAKKGQYFGDYAIHNHYGTWKNI